jgi:predicted AAA+ superfamily ATPase
MKRPMQDYVYLNFENNVLADFTSRNFEDILIAYKELYGNRSPVLFLDEVHRIPQWELFVRKLVDTRYRVFITGSNARLLSQEYATHLGGRYLELEIFPLTFREFLQFKNISYNEHILYSDQRFEILTQFEEYLQLGGFPEIVLTQNRLLKEKLIETYFKTAFFRDIVDRFKIRDEILFEIILKKTAENIGQPFSFRSIKNKLHTLGFRVSPKTIVQYFDYAIRGYLLVPSYLRRESVVQKEKERKMYFIDNGYLGTYYLSPNRGKILENAVALNFRFNGEKLFYFRNTLEIDFVMKDEIPVQVTYDFSDETTQQREIRGLFRYLQFTGKKEGYILTWNDSAHLEQEGKQIHIVPAWYFLLFFI